MKKQALSILLCIGLSPLLTAEPKKLNCNERIKHGPRGLAHGIMSIVGGLALWKLGGQLSEAWNINGTPREKFFQYSPSAIGCIALGYCTYYLGASCIESLSIFFSDDEEEPVVINPLRGDTLDTASEQTETEEATSV